MTWNNSDTHPLDQSVCVVLTRDRLGLWERHLAQCSRGVWYYLGSTEKLRDVDFWYQLPALPLPLVET